MCFFRKRREKKRQALKAHALQSQKEAPNVVGDQPKAEKIVSTEQETKTEPKVKETNTTTPENKPKQAKPQKYHVSQNKDEDSDSYKKWRVRKEGSTKTIKFFDTQKEAIEYAEDLAKNAGSSVVIHKMDGSIRKQDYVKK